MKHGFRKRLAPTPDQVHNAFLRYREQHYDRKEVVYKFADRLIVSTAAYQRIKDQLRTPMHRVLFSGGVPIVIDDNICQTRWVKKKSKRRLAWERNKINSHSFSTSGPDGGTMNSQPSPLLPGGSNATLQS